MSFQARIVPATAQDCRSGIRRLVGCSAFVGGGDESGSIVQVRDLGTNGCRISGSVGLAEDAAVWLKIAGLAPLKARVAWIADEEAGCEFEFPLHPSTVEQIAAPTRQVRKGAFGAAGQGYAQRR